LHDSGFERGVEWELRLARQTLDAIEAHRSKTYEF
jgi:hypothetical protein